MKKIDLSKKFLILLYNKQEVLSNMTLSDESYKSVIIFKFNHFSRQNTSIIILELLDCIIVQIERYILNVKQRLNRILILNISFDKDKDQLMIFKTFYSL